ncbi:MAG: hypothetical protein LKG27_06010 [Clostridiaceae bacterium]|jgi:hypothetical protein|nr:hypothetical protein [Clostridiaceae bacterium]
MQVQAIGISPQFTSRRHSRDNIDNFITLNDKDVQFLALAKTNATVDDRRHRDIDRAIFMGIPLVAGISAAALTKAPTTMFGVPMVRRAAKVANGVKEAGRWAGMFAVLDLAMFGINKLTKNSKGLRDFNKNHPFLASLGAIGVGLGALDLAEKGLVKTVENIKPEKIFKTQMKLDKLATKINSNNLLKSIETHSIKFADKLPSALKGVGRTALGWAPLAMLVGGMIHSINHSNAKAKEFYNNYADLKVRKDALTQSRLSELQESQNVEE